MRQGFVPLFFKAWLVPCCTSTSPVFVCTSVMQKRNELGAVRRASMSMLRPLTTHLFSLCARRSDDLLP